LPLGKVVSGSLKDGVKIILESSEDIEDYPVGGLITIRGNQKEYLALVSDVGVKGDSAPITALSGIRDEYYKAIISELRGKYSYGWLEAILIAETYGNEAYESETFPGYSSIIPDNYQDLLYKFFDKANNTTHWDIGVPKTPKRVDIKIPINISRLVELSFGIFGKSGTGKTFLGNILASYFMLYDDYLASKGYVEGKPIRLLIFDMHSEYGVYLKDNLGNKIADGVGQLAKDKFVIYSPSKDLYEKYEGIRPLKINYLDLDETDIYMLSDVFGVTDAFKSRIYDFIKLIRDKFRLKEYWIIGLLATKELQEKLAKSSRGLEILDEIRSRSGVRDLEGLKEYIIEEIKDKWGTGTEISYRSQIPKLYTLLRYPFTLEEVESPISEIVDYLVSREGVSVIISMGEYERETPLYMIIANLIARRLRSKIYSIGEPKTKIVIFLEEAHKFLGKDVYYQSPFGNVAREMRKMGVTLCVIDQKPGELDRDVISMLWTNFIFTLTDQRDVDISVIGSPNPQLYSKIVPKLRRRTALIYGDAIKFPVVVEIIDYKIVENLLKSRKKIDIDELIDDLKEV